MLKVLDHNGGSDEFNPVWLMVDSVRVATASRFASCPGCAASWPSRLVTSSKNRFRQLP